MAETAGLIQKLQILPGTGNTSYGCVWIGPTPANTELLFVSRKDSDNAHTGAFKNSMVDALATAMVARREVIATHGDSDAIITMLRIDPA
jgi:hypothetical protein